MSERSERPEHGRTAPARAAVLAAAVLGALGVLVGGVRAAAAPAGQASAAKKAKRASGKAGKTAKPGKTPAGKTGKTPAAKAGPSLPGLTTWTLPNGLTVVDVERPDIPMVTVQVWYRFGSSDEPDGERGSARMFERLMFLGSERVRPNQHRQMIEALGGETSALTTEDVTAYHDTVPIDYLDTALELEAERMRHLFLQAGTVRGVQAQLVSELRHQQGSPLYRAYEILLATAFTTHGYAVPPTGLADDLEKLTPKKIQALYDRYYQPNNALLVVVGGSPVAKVKSAVLHWFGGIARAPDPPHPALEHPEPLQTQIRRQEMTGSPVGLVLVGYHLPPATDASSAALQVVGALLTGGDQSLLHRRLVERKLAADVGGQVLAHRGGGLLLTYARAGSGSIDALEKALLADIERLAARGVGAADLARAKNQVLGAVRFGMEGATGLANQLGVSWALEGNPTSYVADLEAIEKVSSRDVQKAAATYLARSKATLVVAPPSGPRGGGKP